MSALILYQCKVCSKWVAEKEFNAATNTCTSCKPAAPPEIKRFAAQLRIGFKILDLLKGRK